MSFDVGLEIVTKQSRGIEISMGRDLTLYPRKASKLDLKGYLESLSFKRCDHLWDWPEGTLNYNWFDSQDFRSIDGVSADVYPTEDEERVITGNA